MSGAPILVLEDDPADVFFIARALKGSAIQNPIVTFPMAELARTYLDAIGESSPPALCILDIALPGVETGLDFLRWLRSQPAPLGQTPAMMLTGSDEPADHDEAQLLGAVMVLTKPVKPEVVAAAVDVLGFAIGPGGVLQRTVVKGSENQR